MCPALLVLSLLMLCACQPPVPKLAGSGMDMFAPVAIRLHPLSRLVTPTTTASQPSPTPVLEARVELTDQFGDPTKSPGNIKIDLNDQPPLIHKGDLLQSWTFSIDKPEENRDHWDRTTRTYLFKLPLSAKPPQRDHLLATVTLTLPNRAVLTDEMEMPLK